MLDMKFVRSNPEIIAEALQKRGGKISLDEFLKLEEQRRALILQVEELRSERNEISKEVGRVKASGGNADEIMLRSREIGEKINSLDGELKEAEDRLEEILLGLPNIPHESVPVGADDEANIEMRRWKTPPTFDFEPQAHWDIGEALGILDFARGAKIAGARFTVYKDAGARLERAIINFFLDKHTRDNGYTEVLPPFLVNSGSMLGTGQLPKFKEDMFKVENTDYYLIPTAEVPITNLFSGEILVEEDLPVCYAAYSACFRAEAGAAGRDTRGLIRQHQFNKVELVKFSLPENSYYELEKLTMNAESVLQALELPYRVVCLSTGDMGFGAAKTYDIEVWMPSYNGYKEISSCSNYESFQARRANIRFKRGQGKPEFLHTLNGSGVAIGRTVAAILENYQLSDGSVKIPEVLIPYMGTDYIK